MAMAQPQEQEPLHMTEAEYLDFERQSETKHEYVAGYIYAMTGASWNHVMICQSTGSTLYTQLRGKPCRVATSDLRLKVTSKKVSYRYPDIMVICGEPEFIDDRTDTITNPTVVIEVLSPSTALTDHNEKLDEYIKIPSLQHYMLISQHEPKIEVYTRHEAGNWLYTQYKSMDSRITLASIDCTLILEDVYEQINFEQNSDA